MSRVELELMWQLKRVLGEAGAFVVTFADGDMDPELVLTFAGELGELAERFRRHAVHTFSTIPGEVVLEAEVMPVAVERLALPVGESSTSPRV